MKRNKIIFLSLVVILTLFVLAFEMTPAIEANALTYGKFGSKPEMVTSGSMGGKYRNIADKKYGNGNNNNNGCDDGEYFYAVITSANVDGVSAFLGIGKPNGGESTSWDRGTRLYWHKPTDINGYNYHLWFVWRFECQKIGNDTYWFIEPAASRKNSPGTLATEYETTIHPSGGEGSADHGTDLLIWNEWRDGVAWQIQTITENRYVGKGNYKQLRNGACRLGLYGKNLYLGMSYNENEKVHEAKLLKDDGSQNHEVHIHALVNHNEVLSNYSSTNKTFTTTITAKSLNNTISSTEDKGTVKLNAATSNMEANRRWTFTFDDGGLYYSWKISNGNGDLAAVSSLSNNGPHNVKTYSSTSSGANTICARWYMCYNIFNCDQTVYFLNLRSECFVLDSQGDSGGNLVTKMMSSTSNDKLSATQSFYINPTARKLTIHHYLNGTTTKICGDTTTDSAYFNELITSAKYAQSGANYTCCSGNIFRDYDTTEFTIYYLSDISNVNFVGVETSFTYDGKEKTVKTSVSHKNTPTGAAVTLAEGTDYNLSNITQTNAGTYKATLTSTEKGKIGKGTKEVEWKINKANQQSVLSTVNNATENIFNYSAVSNQKYLVTTDTETPSTSSGSWITTNENSITKSEFVPDGTTYYIWTYVPGDSNHNQSPLVKTEVSANYVNYHYEYGKTPYSQVYLTGNGVSLEYDNSQLLLDWKFKHWCASPDSNEKVESLTMGKTAVDFYAFYEKDISAKFFFNDGKDGSVSYPRTLSKNVGKELTATATVKDFPTEFSKGEEYEFLGWSLLEDGASASDMISDGTITISEDTNIYAYWIHFPKANSSIEVSNGGSLSVETAIVSNNHSKNNISYQWYEITENGVKAIENATEATYTPSKKNAAYKCVVTYFGKKEKQSISALIHGDVLVDSNFANENNKSCFDFTSVVDKDTVIPAKSTSVFGVSSDKVSIVKVSDTFGMSYKVYGVKSDDKVLVFDSESNTRKGFLGLNDGVSNMGVSNEGFKFDSYIVEVTNSADTNATINREDIVLVKAPRVYELATEGKKTFKTSYHTVDGAIYSDNEYRTKAGNKIYFYEGDYIKIDIPVTHGYKLTAGSHITINGVKVFPTQSVPTDGYISFIYTNYYESLIDRTENVEPKSIKIDDLNPKDIYVEQYTDETPNSGMHNLNFGPLGAKIRDDGKIRFGTVWYFDDTATQNSWSREDGMGTYIIPFKNLLKNTEGNDFDAYLKQFPIDDEKIVEAYDLLGINAKLSYQEIINKWNNSIVDNIVNPEGVAFMLPYLKDFINTWNSKRQTSSTEGLTAEEKAEKIKQMSFGGVEAKSTATMYYYKTDENGKRFLEYSVVMGINDSFKNRQLIHIPYASFVADWDNGFLAPNNDKYADDIYLYQAPEKVYTYNEVAKKSIQ